MEKIITAYRKYFVNFAHGFFTAYRKYFTILLTGFSYSENILENAYARFSLLIMQVMKRTTDAAI